MAFDHTDVVAAVKSYLLAVGASLSGSDGAFAITQRVAWRLKDERAGLLSKPTGNNSGGFAVDIIAYPDGTIVDCLRDSGGENGPQWNVQPDKVDPARWRAPSDPGDGAAAASGAGAGSADPAPGAASSATMEQVLTAIETLGGDVRDLITAVDTLSNRLQYINEHGARLHVS